MTKPSVLLDLAKMKNCFLISLTETHLSSNISNVELTTEGWDLYRTDRLERFGGGVAVYIKQSFSVSDQLNFSSDMCELLGLYLPLSKTAVVTLYRPPNCEVSDFSQALDSIKSWISTLESKYNTTPTIVLNGDFNFPKMKVWDSAEIVKFLDDIQSRELNNQVIGIMSSQTKMLCDTVQDLFLHQVIEGSTRKGNLLDLFFTSDLDIILDQEVIENVLFSDHSLCVVHTLIVSEPEKEEKQENFYSTTIPQYDLLKATDSDWNRVSTELSNIDWDSLYSNKSPDDITDIFISTVEASIVKNMKKIDCSKPSGFSSNNLIPKPVRKLFKKKCKLSKQLRSVTSIQRCSTIRKNILSIDIELKTYYDDRRRLKESILFEKSKGNKNYMYRFLKRAQKSSSKIGPFLKNGKIMDEKLCEILKSQYEKVFTTPMDIYKINDPASFFSPKFNCQDCKNERVHFCPLDMEPNLQNFHDVNHITINPIVIQSIMEKLEPSMASGPDGIPAILMKKCAKALAKPLTNLWQLCFDAGVDPHRLKGALVFPNLKDGGKRSDPASWRPISHTSQLSLIFERFIKDILVNHLEMFDFIGDHQFGFRKKRSCLAQLLRFYHNVLKNIEDGHNCDIVIWTSQRHLTK